MADFSRDRFEDFRAKVEAEIAHTFAGLGLTAESIDALEGRLTGRLTIESGTSRLEVPIDVRADLFGDDEDDSPVKQDGCDVEATVETTVDLEEIGGVNPVRVEALRQAWFLGPDDEHPDQIVARARVFAAFLEEGTDG